MKSFRFFLTVLLCSAAVSCSKAYVDGSIPDAAGKQICVKVLGIGKYDSTDTLTVGKDGRFRFSTDVYKGRPRFVYVSYKDRNVASLLLESGDRVRVFSDTLGRDCRISGSEESLRLAEVEKDYAAFLNSLLAVTDRNEYVRLYVAHYRKCVEYVISHPKSLVSIPVLHEKISGSAPVFSQTTDAIHFRNVCDSLKTLYPESEYVKALEAETAQKEKELAFREALRDARQTGFPDVSLPDMKGRQSRLSDVDARAVLLHFWNSADPVQKMMNNEVLLPVYNDFHGRGFEIYAVDLNPDKVTWGSVVNSQKLPWINVSDVRGAASTAASTYNVQTLPTSILIVDGDVLASGIKGEDGLRKELQKRLRP